MLLSNSTILYLLSRYPGRFIKKKKKIIIYTLTYIKIQLE